MPSPHHFHVPASAKEKINAAYDPLSWNEFFDRKEMMQEVILDNNW